MTPPTNPSQPAPRSVEEIDRLIAAFDIYGAIFLGALENPIEYVALQWERRTRLAEDELAKVKAELAKVEAHHAGASARIAELESIIDDIPENQP